MLRGITRLPDLAQQLDVPSILFILKPHSSWSQYRPDGGKFYPEDIDPTLCSHLLYAYNILECAPLRQLYEDEWGGNLEL